ncbi:hypothetical protein FQR65_LT13205 [Abscondita terminalis]|nr:hypothetical protein FQR65_LT13205 [Abscondita terminalis]
MSATIQTGRLFSNQVVRSAVFTCEKSKTFIRKLIPTVIASILHHRTDFDRSNFEQDKYEQVTFYKFRNKVQAESLKRFRRLIKGALEAFDKNYLCQLYFVFVTNDEPCTVVESYNFHFKYVDNLENRREYPKRFPNKHQPSRCVFSDAFQRLPHCGIDNRHTGSISLRHNAGREEEVIDAVLDDRIVNAALEVENQRDFAAVYNSNIHCKLSTTISANSIMQSLIDLLKSIEKLGSCDNILKQSDVFPQLCITYYDEITPPNYQAPGFLSADNSHENITNAISNESSDHVEFGVSETFYHCVVYRRKQMKETASAKNCIKTITDQPNDFCNTLEVNCFCTANGRYKNIALIECTNCSSLQHAICLGYLNDNHTKEFHYCEWCRDTTASSTPTNLCRRRLMCIYRLCLAYMYLNKALPTDVLKDVDDHIRGVIVKKLTISNIIEDSADGYCLNEMVIDAVVRKLFANNGFGSEL